MSLGVFIHMDLGNLRLKFGDDGLIGDIYGCSVGSFLVVVWGHF